MTPEGRLRAKIRDSLAIQEVRYGGNLTYWSVADAYLSGQPDMMACLNGHLFALELKAEHGVLEPIQKFVLARYDRAGATAGVLRAMQSAPLGFVFERMDHKKGLEEPFEVSSATSWLEQLSSLPLQSAPLARRSTG